MKPTDDPIQDFVDAGHTLACMFVGTPRAEFFKGTTYTQLILRACAEITAFVDDDHKNDCYLSGKTKHDAVRELEKIVAQMATDYTQAKKEEDRDV